MLKVSYKNWMFGDWEGIDGETVEREVNNAYKVLYKTSKAFAQKELIKYSENADEVRKEVETFKKYVPLVQVSYTSHRKNSNRTKVVLLTVVFLTGIKQPRNA